MHYLVQLRSFLETYRTSSITKAAERLNLTQPAVSTHIQILENLIGKSLFIRGARGVQATPTADELAKTIAPYIDGLETQIAAMHQYSQVLAGTVNIAAPAEFLSVYIADIVKSLLNKNLYLRFMTGNREHIYAALSEDKVELAFTASLPDETQYEFVQIATERLILVVAQTLLEQLPAHEAITLADLANIPMLAYSETLPLITSLFDQMIHRRADITLADLRIVKDLLCHGYGWSVLPEYLCQAELASGKLVELKTAKPAQQNSFYLVWNKGALRQPRTLYVRDCILQQAKNKQYTL